MGWLGFCALLSQAKTTHRVAAKPQASIRVPLALVLAAGRLLTDRCADGKVQCQTSAKTASKVCMDVQHFKPSELSVKVKDNSIVFEEKHEEREDDHGYISRHFLVGQASLKNKGKMSRSLAAKASLATRLDAFGEEATFETGAAHKVKLEARLRLLEEGNLRKLSSTGKAKAKFEKYQVKSEVLTYDGGADSTLSIKNRKHSEAEPEVAVKKEEPVEEEAEEAASSKPKKKKKKKKSESENPDKKPKLEES